MIHHPYQVSISIHRYSTGENIQFLPLLRTWFRSGLGRRITLVIASLASRLRARQSPLPLRGLSGRRARRHRVCFGDVIRRRNGRISQRRSRRSLLLLDRRRGSGGGLVVGGLVHGGIRFGLDGSVFGVGRGIGETTQEMRGELKNNDSLAAACAVGPTVRGTGSHDELVVEAYGGTVVEK